MFGEILECSKFQFGSGSAPKIRQKKNPIISNYPKSWDNWKIEGLFSSTFLQSKAQVLYCLLAIFTFPLLSLKHLPTCGAA